MADPKPSSAAQYVDTLAANGRHHFTTDQAVDALDVSVPAARAALRRLKAKGVIADPYRGFFVILPPEYRRLGCLPAEQFVPQLMDHLGEPYYVALLSAAELHGAAHHRPQAFQVMLRANRRPVECGKVRVQFIARKDMRKTQCIDRRTPRGMLRVASAEATALELVGYVDHCGGLDNVALVVRDLAGELDGQKLVRAARLCPIVWTQRLGHILDLTEHRSLANALASYVRKRAPVVAPLLRARPMAGAEYNERWKMAVNTTVELDA